MIHIYTLDIIVPCYNEEESVKPFYESITDVLATLDYIDPRFIFIDDGSTDKTLEKIKEIVKRDRRCVYVSFAKNFGKDSAMLAGLKFSNAEFACIIDANLQHPPELIPKMLSALIDEDYDVAATKRSSRKSSGTKEKMSENFYKIFNKLSDSHLEQNAQDFRIMKRKVVNAILCVRECNRFSRGIFDWVGYKTKWFEHEDKERKAGNSKWSFKDLFNYAITATVSFSDFPLKIPTGLGILLLAVWLIRFIISIIRCLILPMACLRDIDICFVGGLILISLGIIGEYLSRVLLEAKHRPDFIITETNVLFDEHSRNNYTFDVIDIYDEELSAMEYREEINRRKREAEREAEIEEEIRRRRERDRRRHEESSSKPIDESDIPDISQEAFNYED